MLTKAAMPSTEQDHLAGDHRWQETGPARKAIDELTSLRVALQLRGAHSRRSQRALGGERNRDTSARILKEGANVLLLDEPTNDLDVKHHAGLEEALENFGRLRRRHQPRPLVPR